MDFCSGKPYSDFFLNRGLFVVTVLFVCVCVCARARARACMWVCEGQRTGCKSHFFYHVGFRDQLRSSGLVEGTFT